MTRFFQKSVGLLLALGISTSLPAQMKMNYDQYPVYEGEDLGISYRPGQTVFRLWAPSAEAVRLHRYRSGHQNDRIETLPLQKDKSGTWSLAVKGDIKNTYYSFEVKHEGAWLGETADPYARAVGVNGARGMVVNLKETDPEGWEKDRGPNLPQYTDIVLYESQVRDFSIAANSGIRHKGKFLGMTETGTKGPGGVKTGLDHLEELGITHVHLLPSFDFNSIDETRLGQPQYNWGYDPLHYNVPEGSFSTNPFDGAVRIREFKQMVQALHSKGIGVIMDVVYNHTSGFKTPFNLTVPGYYYRQTADGKYSDASACGNETASERAMMRKFIVESVAYWAREYHIDGFRFDLMGIHDIETMNLVRDTLYRINPSIFIYGEGWTAGSSPLAENLRAVKKNTYQLKDIAAFSDDLRDALRGPYSNAKQSGFTAGVTGLAPSLQFGIVGSTQHPGVDYKLVNYSKAPWAASPHQTISYASCHDDPTLFDRLHESNPDKTEEELIRMDRLAQTVVFTSQGIPFLHSGAEMLRTKKGVHNSYNAPDSINEIDWSRKHRYAGAYTYYKNLLSLRRNHPSFRLPTTEAIQQHLQFLPSTDPLLVGYTIRDVKGDRWKEILIFINGEGKEKEVALPAGNWKLAADGERIEEGGMGEVSGKMKLPPTAACILFKD